MPERSVPRKDKDPLFSAAVLKLSMVQKGLGGTPGFRVVYAGVLKELGIRDAAVEDYIAKNKERLLSHIAAAASSAGED